MVSPTDALFKCGQTRSFTFRPGISVDNASRPQYFQADYSALSDRQTLAAELSPEMSWATLMNPMT